MQKMTRRFATAVLAMTTALTPACGQSTNRSDQGLAGGSKIDPGTVIPSCTAATGTQPGPQVPSYVDEPIEQLKKMVPGLSGIKIEGVRNASAGTPTAPVQDKTTFILNRTSAVIAGLFHRMPNLIAKEEVKEPTDTEMKNDLPRRGGGGWIASTQQRIPITHFKTSVYTYRIVHKQTPADGDTVDEFRTDAHDQPIDDSAHNAQRPVSVGFANTWLFFFPGNLQQSRFRYLGVQKIGNRETYVLAFAQNPVHLGVRVVLGSRYGPCSTSIQGVAWIDQSTFQIVRTQTDLLTPLPGIQVNQLRSNLEYGAVRIRALDLTLWLPAKVDIQWQTESRAGEETHLYSHYKLFQSTARILPADESPAP
jgi:hypothetical protein